MELKERIVTQKVMADNVITDINDDLETDIDMPTFLDTLARHGYELNKITDHNVASYAYMVELGMDMDTLLQQADPNHPDFVG